MDKGATKVMAARLYAGYLRHFPIRKWKKAISSRVGHLMEGVPVQTAYGFPIYSKFHDRTNRVGVQGKLGILPDFVRQVPAGACFVDIWANHGVITIMAARQVGPAGCVLAFEPVPDTFAALERNLALNRLDNVTAFPMAVAARSTAVRMSPADPLHSGSARIEAHEAGDVPAAPLTDIPGVATAMGDRPVFAKVDTEGYELEVLRGMGPLLEAGRIASMVIEIDDGHLRRFGASASAVYEELARYDYRPRLHDGPAGRHYDEIFDRAGARRGGRDGNSSAV
jgi:FkbM family methyltransferase